jgi:hypothetical protein
MVVTVQNWATFASLATAVGTLVLALATFASIRSANRSARTAERAARIAERALLAGQRPLLVTSRPQDPELKIEFFGGSWLRVPGARAGIEVNDDAIYMAISVRNVGTGLAVLHGWHVLDSRERPLERVHPPLDEFIGQIRDIYVAPSETALWQGALRDPAGEVFHKALAAIDEGGIVISLLYGDFEAGQRVMTEFALRRAHESWFTSVTRHYSIDEPDPRYSDGAWADAVSRRARQIRDGFSRAAPADSELPESG